LLYRASISTSFPLRALCSSALSALKNADFVQALTAPVQFQPDHCRVARPANEISAIARRQTALLNAN
jgi:hypothetical protein